MNSVRPMHGIGDGLSGLWRDLLGGRRLSRGAAWGLMILAALIAFEIFNFSTTEFALRDVLGDLAFASLRWSIILAIAFCVMDFAGIARIFTPERGRDEPAEVWYLFGAWLLAAGFNATLTWWGVSVAIARQASASSGLLMSDRLTTVVPVFVAVMVWLIRVLIIGTFSIAGDRLFSTGASPAGSRLFNPSQASSRAPVPSSAARPVSAMPRPSAPALRSAPKPSPTPAFERMEPTYHSVSMDAAGSEAGRERHLQ